MQRILRDDVIRFRLKHFGIAYDRHQYDISFKKMEDADFWACDALALPFKTKAFNFVSALNVIDIVTSPLALLTSMRNILIAGGNVAMPY